MLVVIVLIGFVVTAVVTKLSGLWTLGIISGLCVFPVLIVVWDIGAWLRNRRRTADGTSPQTDPVTGRMP